MSSDYSRTNRKARKKYKTDYAQKMLKQKHYSSILLAVDKKENEETNEKTQFLTLKHSSFILKWEL